MKKLLLPLLILSTPLTLGIAMPSCPGKEDQEQLKQQMDQLSQRESGTQNQVQQLQAQLAETQKSLNEARTLLTEVSNTVLSHRDALAKLDQSMQALAAASKTAPKAAPKPSKPGNRHR